MIENFAPNLTKLRLNADLSQKELAEELNISTQTISNIEKGKAYPTFTNLEKIATYFKATPTQLFGTEQEQQLEISGNNIDEYVQKAREIILASKALEDNMDTFYELTDKNNYAGYDPATNEILYRYRDVKTGKTYVTNDDVPEENSIPDYGPSLLERIEKLANKMQNVRYNGEDYFSE